MATIILDKPYILQPEKSTTYIEVICYTDNPIEKTIVASILLNSEGKSIGLLLWADAEYDAIGQWTDAQAEARIKELLES